MYFILIFLLLASTAMPAKANPLPLPRTDFVVKSKGPEGSMFTYRHHDGKLRVDVKLAGIPIATTAIVDISTRKVLALIGAPDSGMAVELDLNEAQFGLAPTSLDAKQVGSATVAGEQCDLFETVAPPRKIAAKSVPPSKTISCITPDGITLRLEAVSNAGHQVVMEAIEITRVRQDAKLFAPPPGTKVIKAPAGMAGLLGAISGAGSLKP